MQDETKIALMCVGGLVVFLGISLGAVACNSCTGDTTPPAPTTAPTLYVPPVPEAGPPEVRWAVVEVLENVKGRWGAPPDGKGAWVHIEKKKGSIYPWRLQFAADTRDEPWDCGVYKTLTDDWRTGYCKDTDPKNPRKASKVTLHIKPTKPNQLRVNVDGTSTLTVSRD